MYDERNSRIDMVNACKNDRYDRLPQADDEEVIKVCSDMIDFDVV